MVQVEPNSRLRGCDWSRACTSTCTGTSFSKGKQNAAQCKEGRRIANCLVILSCDCLPRCGVHKARAIGKSLKERFFHLSSFIFLPQLFISSPHPSTKHSLSLCQPQTPKIPPAKKSQEGQEVVDDPRF